MGQYKVVTQLLEKHVPCDTTNKDNLTPYHYAVKHNRYQVVEILLGYGFDVNALENNKDKTLFPSAKDLATDKVLYEVSKAQGLFMSKKNMLPLQCQSSTETRYNQCLKVVEIITSLGKNGEEVAQKIGALLALNQNINRFISKYIRRTPLHWAALHADRLECIKKLIAAGVPVDAVDKVIK